MHVLPAQSQPLFMQNTSLSILESKVRELDDALRTTLQVGCGVSSALVIVDCHGIVQFSSAMADEMIKEIFGETCRKNYQLPDCLSDWFGQALGKAGEKEDTSYRTRYAVLVGPQASMRATLLGGKSRFLHTIHLEIIAHSPEKAASTTLSSGGELSPIPGLTPREQEVLRQLVMGRQNKEIAEILGVSHRTIEGHIRKICEKLGAKNRASAMAIALSITSHDNPA